MRGRLAIDSPPGPHNLRAMTALSRCTADLPGTGGEWRDHLGGCEEVLANEPGGDGKHVWVKVAKTDLGSQQARAAVARAVHAPTESVSFAGNRERRGRCVQWFSLPEDLVEYPQALKTAGAHGKVKVLTITRSKRPVSEASVVRLRWSAHIKGGATNDGYRRATAILDRLRTAGCPNYVAASRLGKQGSFARWGRLLVEGRRLPQQAVREAEPGRCLGAFQSALFNRWLATRLDDGLLSSVLAGDRVLTSRGEEQTVDDVKRWQARLDSWEAVAMGPLFGAGMSPAAEVAAQREQTLLEAESLDTAMVARLHGARRAIRFQPAKPLIDIAGENLAISVDLPPDSYLAVLLEEVIKPEGHLE
ncbi:MAG: tRNA pseudouridine(13) synthase TruD [Planctomycetes bacterium]|nr:tRNA pseudouridine(13) synthase TruD [Planctomycetota bacterium]